MTLAPRKRTRATIVSPKAVEQATVLLEELPEKPKEDLSLREAVGQMQDSLKAALAKGYTYEELAQMLAQQGIQISAFTLKNYVPSGKRSAPKGKIRKSKKNQGEDLDLEIDTPELDEEPLEEDIPEPEAKPARAARSSTATKTTGTRRRKQS